MRAAEVKDLVRNCCGSFAAGSGGCCGPHHRIAGSLSLPGRGIADCVASATIEGRKPG
jgi:hypothetical protein